MMKRFEKIGKVTGFLLVATALLFAGCMADSGGSSSSEGAVPASSQAGTAIPMTMDPESMTLTIGDGQGMKVVTIVGTNDGLDHQIALVNGSTTGAVCAAYPAGDARCWVQLVNLDNDSYMANAMINIKSCPVGCGSASLDNCDLKGGVVLSGTGTGNPGVTCSISDADSTSNLVQICVVEDGQYSPTPAPFNPNGCPTHQVNPAAANVHKPFQIIQPGGSKGNEWLFSGQGTSYQFFAWVTSDYFPYTNVIADATTANDPRFDMENRSTFYVTVNAVADGSTAPNINWYRIGAYQRSKTLSGWNATGSNELTPYPGDQRYFAVNVLLDYPNRIESYVMGEPLVNENHEYYTQFSYLLRYDPGVVAPKGANGKTQAGTVGIRTGLQQHCSSAGNCGKGKETFTQYATPASGSFSGYGIIGTAISMSNSTGGESFSLFSLDTNYETVHGGAVALNTYAPIMGCAGHHGVARLDMALAACTSGATGCMIQDGPDMEPEMELSLIYFKILSNHNGTGSEFWIDTYSGYTSFTMGWTNGTLIPSGLVGGSDDWVGYCLDPAGAGVPEQPCPPSTATMVVRGGVEVSNSNLGQAGNNGSAFDPSNPGQFQSWPASIVVQ